jgi:hypothetical protein
MSRVVGEVRPSQLLFSNGVGALIDLPYMTVLPLGLDDWDSAHLTALDEERLLAGVRLRLGPQVDRLLMPPVAPEEPGNGGSEIRGVPTVPFPRWLVCSHCRTMAPIAMNIFGLKIDEFHPDRSGFFHTYCSAARQGKPPMAFPSRFLVACRAGHLDDFPWLLYVHRGPSSCGGVMKLNERGVSGEAREVIVTCQECNKSRPMTEAFDRRNTAIAVCRGRRIHLRDNEATQCAERPRTMLIGASNLWFSFTLSVLALPSSGGALEQVVADLWNDYLATVTVKEMLPTLLTMPPFRRLLPFKVEDIWAAIEKRRAGGGRAGAEGRDLKGPEWRLLTSPEAAPSTDDFSLISGLVPRKFMPYFERVVLAERLREVQALTGFTRIGAPVDPLEGAGGNSSRIVPLSRTPPRWVPAAESRGEGIFIQFREEAVSAWLSQPAVIEAGKVLLAAHIAWRNARELTPPADGFPGMRFVLIHSFAHALARQLSLACGYATASLKERLYVRDPGQPGGPMAGVLIYTAASDSEGTLGGLVSQGQVESLNGHLSSALEQMEFCSCDPLCAESRPEADGRTLNGASCHACLLSPETSCERGNRYLDRAALVELTAGPVMPFFKAH